MRTDVPTARGPERRGWHIDKTISATDVLTLVGMLLLGVGAYFNLKQDGAVQAAQIQYIERQRTEDRASTERALSDLNTRLSRIDDKLEKIADRLGAKQ